MDRCTHEVRMQYWKDIISQCQARETGQSAKQWLKENGICEQTYYLWQRRIRQETYTQMKEQTETLPAVQADAGITFTEIPLPTQERTLSDPAGQYPTPAAVIRTADMTIALSADISEALLTRILREVSHA